MYPEAADSLGPDYCRGCHLLSAACLCELAPILQSRASFLLLVHARELTKPSNTGHLLLNSIEGSRYEVWSRRESDAVLSELLGATGRQPCLLFPGLEGGAAGQNGPRRIAAKSLAGMPQPLFILLDATWQQAAKIYRQSPYLQSLPLLSLQPQRESCYSLRRHQQSGNLSTAEVVVELLQLLGEPQQADQFDHYYRDFMYHYQASRSGHAPVGIGIGNNVHHGGESRS